MSGFTIVELLLGIMLSALIAVSVYETLFSGIRISQRIAGSVGGDSRQIMIVIDTFAREIANAIAYDFSPSYPSRFSFEGDKRRVTFLNGDARGIRVIRYSLVPPEKEKGVHKTILGGHYTKNIKVEESRTQADRMMNFVREEMDFTGYVAGGFRMQGEPEVLIRSVAVDGLTLSYAVRELPGEGADGNTGENGQKTAGVIFSAEDWKANLPPLTVFIELKIPAQEKRPPQSFSRKVFFPPGFALPGKE
jgi:type II secretory pathway component PulJ